MKKITVLLTVLLSIMTTSLTQAFDPSEKYGADGILFNAGKELFSWISCKTKENVPLYWDYLKTNSVNCLSKTTNTCAWIKKQTPIYWNSTKENSKHCAAKTKETMQKIKEKAKQTASFITENNKLEQPNYFHMLGMISAAAYKKGNIILPSALLFGIPAISSFFETKKQIPTNQKLKKADSDFDTLQRESLKLRLLQTIAGAAALKAGVFGIKIGSWFMHATIKI